MADDLVSSLESSLQSCVSLLLSNEGIEKGQHHNDNTKGVEFTITKFLKNAQALEADFLNKQMYIRLNQPQETTKQEVGHLKTELAQKEELLNKLSERVDYWNKILDDLQRKQTEIEAADRKIPQVQTSAQKTL
ncbi:predicted protein [Nematostella vectensis]|uniref:Mediator of RNA polymerase II transcription subunit 28 n=2 Tax=Nematostella vectensis TaxID=45351 RepID=A7S0P6_NEMVE|nr:predicted protein [Nematostella vectensis]|eukprot:XP_001634838.1 predicted protein [Nematostella vectensis]